jgi:hypothetical protein
MQNRIVTPYHILDQRESFYMVQVNVDLLGILLVEIPTDLLYLIDFDAPATIDNGLIRFEIDGELSEGFVFHRVETAEN